MYIWGSVMLLINIMLVSAIIFILVRGKKDMKAVVSTAQMNLNASNDNAATLRGEMSAFIGKSQAQMSDAGTIKETGSRLIESHREMERALSKSAEVAKQIDELYGRRPAPVDYSGVFRLVRQ